MSSRPRARRRGAVGWWALALVAVVAWAGGLTAVAWQKYHPAPKLAAVLAPPPAAPADPPAPPPPPEPKVVTVVVPVVVPAPPPPPAAPDPRPFWARDLAAVGPAPDADAPAGGCQTFGTAVKFVGSAPEAMRRAAADGKLVYVLHLAGNLEDDGFT